MKRKVWEGGKRIKEEENGEEERKLMDLRYTAIVLLSVAATSRQMLNDLIKFLEIS